VGLRTLQQTSRESGEGRSRCTRKPSGKRCASLTSCRKRRIINRPSMRIPVGGQAKMEYGPFSRRSALAEPIGGTNHLPAADDPHESKEKTP
jgi:hypothetical protein